MGRASNSALAAMVAAAFATSAFANTWTNTLGGVFSDGGNWKEGAAPTIAGDANFGTAPGTYTVHFTGDAESAAVTFDNDQNVTLDVGAGNTWTIANNKYFIIGDGATSSEADTSVSIVSGCVTGAYKILTAHRLVKAVHLTVANPGTVFSSNRDDLNIGWNGPNTTVVVTNGATLRGGRSTLMGQSAAASNNCVLVTGEGSWFGNGSTSGNSGLMVGWRSQGNRLVAEKGAFVHCEQNNLVVGHEAGANGNTMIVRDGSYLDVPNSQLFVGGSGSGNRVEISNGSTGVVAGQTLVGNASCGNTLEITGGSLYMPGTHLYLGQGSAASSNAVRIAGAGTVVTNKNYDFNCGNNGSFNTWIVEDGAYVRPVRSFITGTAGQSSHNLTRISGEGTLVETIQADLVAGQVGTSNTVVVTDNARANIGSSLIVGKNAGACSNLLVIADGAVVTNNSSVLVGGNVAAVGNALVISNAAVHSKGVVNIGNPGHHCRLEVLDGATFSTGHHFYFGGPVGASNTVVLVSGEGTRLDNRYDIDVGMNARDCRMDILDGAVVVDNRHCYVGRNSSSSNNVLHVENATLTVTTDNNCSLIVNYGSRLEIAGSNTTVRASQLQFHGQSTLAFEIPGEGFATPVYTRRPTYGEGTKLEIDATAFAKAGGGWITLMEYLDKTGTITGNMTLKPEGILVEETGTELCIKVPNYEGTLLLLR